jgi:pimeloyl-ACP methyl ester carboxylesterase
VINRRQLYLETAPDADASWPSWHTSAWLTVPAQLRRAEIHVLVHGAGSDHRAWDWPMEPDRYSYVDWATRRGIATLTIDRIGCGFSSRPPGAEVTLERQADSLHQIVQALRRGLPGCPKFSRVALVGHSLGAVVVGTQAAMFGDADEVVLSGYVPTDGGDIPPELFDIAFLPATQVQTRLRGLVDDDYWGQRPDIDDGSLAFHAPGVDADVMQAERQMLGTTTRVELLGAVRAGRFIATFDQPALVLIGQYDRLLLQEGDVDGHDVARRMAAVTGSNFHYEVVPDTGHVLNLHYTAHTTFAAISAWLDQRAGDGAPPA